MSRATLEERVAALERQVDALLANHAGTGRTKDWRRTRGAFTGDDLMKQAFEEGRKIRRACGKPVCKPPPAAYPHRHHGPEDCVDGPGQRCATHYNQLTGLFPSLRTALRKLVASVRCRPRSATTSRNSADR